jgi:gluconate kinase
MNLSTFFTDAVLKLIIGAAVAALLMGKFWKADFTHPAHVDEQISEVSRLLSAQIQTKEQIISRLSVEAQQAIKERDLAVITSSELSAHLKIYQDSLKAARKGFNMMDFTHIDESGNTAFIDTTLAQQFTFTDNLFGVTCYVKLSRSGCFTLEAELTQLRPLTLSHTIVSPVPGFYQSIFELPDFDLQSTEIITLQTQPEPERRNFLQKYRSELVTYGVAATVVVIAINFLTR